VVAAQPSLANSQVSAEPAEQGKEINLAFFFDSKSLAVGRFIGGEQFQRAAGPA